VTPIAHVGAFPVEELVVPLAYGGCALWLAARAWLSGAARRYWDKLTRRAR
jgi:hypothetical protein